MSKNLKSALKQMANQGKVIKTEPIWFHFQGSKQSRVSGLISDVYLLKDRYSLWCADVQVVGWEVDQ